jgi:hypothetical protein
MATSVSTVLISCAQARKFRLSLFQIALFPSFVVPFGLIVIVYIQILWKLFDAEFDIALLAEGKVDEAVLLVCGSSLLLLSGILLSKFRFLSAIKDKILANPYSGRQLDILLDILTQRRNLSLLIAFAAFVGPFQVGWRLDLFLEGGRGELSINNPLLITLLPLSFILSTILTILAGFCYAKTDKKALFLIALADVLPRLMMLSRAFFLPIILFIFSATLLGKRFPRWVYVTAPAFSVAASSVALTARSVSSGGAAGLASGFGAAQTDVMSSVETFFSNNANVGVFSQAIALRDPTLSPIDGFYRWLATLSPLPSFLQLTGDIPDIGGLLGLQGVGVPMPLFGDIYYQMGWIGLPIVFFIGWWMGRLEANIILNLKYYKTAYWPHILLWLSMLYGFIQCFHSPTRSSSRVLVYSLVLIWVLELTVSLIKRNHQKSSL